MSIAGEVVVLNSGCRLFGQSTQGLRRWGSVLRFVGHVCHCSGEVCGADVFYAPSARANLWELCDAASVAF